MNAYDSSFAGPSEDQEPLAADSNQATKSASAVSWTADWLEGGAADVQPPLVKFNRPLPSGRLDGEGRDTRLTTNEAHLPLYWDSYQRDNVSWDPYISDKALRTEQTNAGYRFTRANLDSVVKALARHTEAGVPTNLGLTLTDLKATKSEANLRVMEVALLRVIAEAYQTKKGSLSTFVFEVLDNDYSKQQLSCQSNDWNAYTRGSEPGGYTARNRGKYSPNIMWKAHLRDSEEGRAIVAGKTS